MENEIEIEIDKQLNIKLQGIIKQKKTTLNVSNTFGIGTPYLVPFVTGIIYTSLQNFMVDFYKSKGIAYDELLKKDWEYFWKKNVKSIMEQLTKIYEL